LQRFFCKIWREAKGVMQKFVPEGIPNIAAPLPSKL